MLTFFHGWRRKTGCITLVMACALCPLWFRSLTRFDRIDGWIVSRLVHGYIVSTNGDLNIIRRFPLPPDHARNSLHLKKWIAWETTFADPIYLVLLERTAYESGPTVNGRPDCWIEFDVAWRFDLGGLHFGQGRHRTWEEWDVQLWTFPYWTLILPLAILAAYLILWTPKKAKRPAPISDSK